MTTPPPAPPPAGGPSHLVRRGLRSVWTWAAVAGLVAVTSGAWAAGGFAQVPEEGLPRVPADARVALGPYDVAIEGWSISREYDPSLLEIVDGDAWLVIGADLTGAPPRSTTYKSDSIEVSSLEPTAYPRAVSPVDGSYVSYIHPGVTTPALILIPVTEEDARTLESLSTLPVLLTSYTYTQHVLSGEETWLRPQPRATAQVPRVDSIVPEVEPEDDR
ncbi:hypothetical protein [Litorihabitans aurantiacus]|uniref:Uncharacterized protein n=1 Tax=Litorihabitans aurantiacus TaxID=1930061 RepID=A0AA38CSL6_9MICO|nr:hypothetical protein [Litorihabitans aurantiacus]GMA30050.1 hypothetical protein GCM10025875_00420 [Litorihabitans aurantiacus]GMA33548.1 hypothetical protein GCM10025875_35400 [Litorihabitans aurantiacus]